MLELQHGEKEVMYKQKLPYLITGPGLPENGAVSVGPDELEKAFEAGRKEIEHENRYLSLTNARLEKVVLSKETFYKGTIRNLQKLRESESKELRSEISGLRSQLSIERGYKSTRDSLLGILSDLQQEIQRLKSPSKSSEVNEQKAKT